MKRRKIESSTNGSPTESSDQVSLFQARSIISLCDWPYLQVKGIDLFSVTREQTGNRYDRISVKAF